MTWLDWLKGSAGDLVVARWKPVAAAGILLMRLGNRWDCEIVKMRAL
jgi:hypothetical protein